MKRVLLASVVCFLMAAPAMAELSLQQILDNITVDPIGNSSVDVATDALVEGTDAYWAIGGSGNGAATLIVEISANSGANTFGIYDAFNEANKIQLFDGAAGTGKKVSVSIYDNGNVEINNTTVVGNLASKNFFGFYLGIPNGTLYSDSLLNADKGDQMKAFQGGAGDIVKIGSLTAGEWLANEYILAWEDIPYFGGSDRDYQDFVVMVESMSPVPVPAAVLLGALGLGAAGLRLRKRG